MAPEQKSDQVKNGPAPQHCVQYTFTRKLTFCPAYYSQPRHPPLWPFYSERSRWPAGPLAADPWYAEPQSRPLTGGSCSYAAWSRTGYCWNSAGCPGAVTGRAVGRDALVACQHHHARGPGRLNSGGWKLPEPLHRSRAACSLSPIAPS